MVRLDVRARAPGAVLVEEQPRQRVVNAGFACGVLTVDVVHALVKVEVQDVEALEVHQIQGFQKDIHASISSSRLLMMSFGVPRRGRSAISSPVSFAPLRTSAARQVASS